ncbi:putative Regulatory protein, LuxR [metagenome]|uniref:Putative Regulatory protein, LuxR n=1 Tax=metagenome TaxID=256318 RepID=A0A2P2C5L7_9ZZZZ
MDSVGASQDVVWVQIVTPQRVVELGMRAMLAGVSAPFTLSTTGPPVADPDVVLFDVICMQEGDTTELDRWLTDTDTTVIAIDRTLRPELGAQARARGVEWSIDLGISDADFVQVVKQAIDGTLADSDIAQEWDSSDYPGQDVGLTRRESSVLELVTRGYGNQQVADELFLSVNSVKSYIRSTYRKIGALTRAQAVAWAVRAGFAGESVTSDPEDSPASQ